MIEYYEIRERGNGAIATDEDWNCFDSKKEAQEAMDDFTKHFKEQEKNNPRGYYDWLYHCPDSFDYKKLYIAEVSNEDAAKRRIAWGWQNSPI